MKSRVSNQVLYALYGAVAGLFFPFAATLLHAWLKHAPLSLHTIAEQQRTEDLFWIIDMAPLVLGTLAAYIGKNRDFYENFLNSIPSDIVVFDKNHRYLFVNPSAVKDPAHRKKMIGMDDFEYCAYRNRDSKFAEERRNQFLIAKNTDGGLKWEETIKDAAGNPVTNLRRFYPVRDSNGHMKIMIGYALDISDRKLLEEKQEVLIKQLQKTNRQLNDFSNIIAHNLRGPLGNITSIVDLIENMDDVEQQKELISYLKPCTESVSAVFNQLIDSLHVMHDVEIEFRNNDLATCLKLVRNSLDLEIKQCQAKISTDLSLAAEVYGPEKYIVSMLHNLVSNAIKYRSPDRQPEILVRTMNEGEEVVLSVADNGLGIDLHKHGDNLFKIGKVFHSNPDSKGFGLFMTKTQVESIGGKIWIDSAPGKGTTFFIMLKKGK